MFVPLVLLLVYGGQVALSDKFKFNFTTVHQCEPVSISFSGSENAKAIPSSLTLIPFGSKPVSIPLPSNSTNATGVTVSFLPLAEGTQFVASLDDDEGENSSRVSDIFRVFPSANGDNSCVPTNVTGTPPYTLPTSVAQCEPFNIAYSTVAPPTVRLFFPRGGSFQLDLLDTSTPGTATYMMNATRQQSVILMAFNDDVQNGMTSNLLTVIGDASSSNSCFVSQNNDKNNDKDKDESRAKSSMSSAVAIGLGVGGGVVLLVTILLAAFLIRRRYRQRRIRNFDFNPALLEKRSSFTKSDYSAQVVPNLNFSSPGVVPNPPYTASRFSSRSSESYPVPTWELPPSQTRQNVDSQPSTSYDIEHMLNMVAERNSDDEFRKATPPEQPEIRELSVKPEPPRIVTTVGRHAAQPSGVPLSAAFDTLTPIEGSPRESFAASVNFEMVSRPAAASLVPSPGLRAPSSRFSDPSFIDVGSIGDFPRPPFATHVPVRDSNDSWGNLGSGR